MIRFIKDILDIKNLLGMQRVPPVPIPVPQFPSDEIVFRAISNVNPSFDFTAYYTGYMSIRVEIGGGQWTTYYNNSGTSVNVNGFNAGSDVIVKGNITRLTQIQDASFVAISDTLPDFDFNSTIETLDLRNAVGLINGYYPLGNNSLKELYANGNRLLGFQIGIIQSSGVNDGILWIDPNGTYASQIIAAAEAKGWSVYEL